MGQSIISAGLIIIVTIAVINANRLVINAETTKLEALARLQAADLAMELITEARMKRFDQQDDPTRYMAATEFTSSSSLGPGSGEFAGDPDYTPYNSASAFNDFDDYDDYTRIANTSSVSGFVISCEVYYATETQPDQNAGYRTYVKTLEVSVSHPQYLTRAVKISFTRTY